MDCCYIVIDRKYLRKEGLIKAYRFGRYFFAVDDVMHYFRSVPDESDLIVITAPMYEFNRIMERNKKLCT